MRLSTSTCIHEKVLWEKQIRYTCQEAIQACVRAGYQVLDMNFASYSRGENPMTQEHWEDWVKELKELSDSLNVTYSQAHAHFYPWSQNPKDQDPFDEELMRRSIIGAGIMKAGWLVIHPGQVTDGVGYNHQKALKRNVEAYRRYADLCAKHGVRIAIENMIEGSAPRRYCSNPEELLELLDALDNDPIFGICWDFGHAHLSRLDQVESLKRIGGKKLACLHVDDNRGEKDDHLAPYFGYIQWEPIMKALKEIGYQGDFTYEIFNFLNGLPDGIHDELLRFTYELGMFMLQMAE